MFLGEMGVFTPSYADLARCGGGFSASSLPTAAHLSCRNKLPGLRALSVLPRTYPSQRVALGKNRTASRPGCPTAPARGCSVFQGDCGLRTGNARDGGIGTYSDTQTCPPDIQVAFLPRVWESKLTAPSGGPPCPAAPRAF